MHLSSAVTEVCVTQKNTKIDANQGKSMKTPKWQKQKREYRKKKKKNRK